METWSLYSPGTHCVDEAGLEFAVSSLSHISSAGIIDMWHHTKIKNCLLLHVCEGLGK